MERVTRIPDLPPRPREGHKGTFGTVLVAAGSPGMPGAAGLCAQAVLRAGAGLCKVACPEPVQPLVAVIAAGATSLPLETETGFFQESHVQRVLQEGAAAGTLAVGPGIDRGPGQERFLARLVRETTVPTVVDADGLNALAGAAREPLERPEGAGALVLTPHPGEAARLLSLTSREVQEDREGTAVKLARWCEGVCLLKGADTVVTDGFRIYVNPTGNPGMATGGSGDVLTGVIAALLAQGMKPFDAAVLGAWLHGRAGDLGSARLGPWSLTAQDLLEELPRAFLDRAAGKIGSEPARDQA